MSGALFIFLGLWETYADLKHPILPPRLFRKTRECVNTPNISAVVSVSLITSFNMLTFLYSFTVVLIVIFVAGMLYYSNLSLWPRISSLLFVDANDTILRGIYTEVTSFGVTLAAFYNVFVMPWIGYERWQLVGLTTVQTAMIGALSGLTLNSKARTIIFTLFAAAASSGTSMLTFGTIGLFLEDQADM